MSSPDLPEYKRQKETARHFAEGCTLSEFTSFNKQTKQNKKSWRRLKFYTEARMRAERFNSQGQHVVWTVAGRKTAGFMGKLACFSVVIFLFELQSPHVGSGLTQSKRLLLFWSADEKRGSRCADGQEVQTERGAADTPDVLQQMRQRTPQGLCVCMWVWVCGGGEVPPRCQMSVI